MNTRTFRAERQWSLAGLPCFAWGLCVAGALLGAAAPAHAQCSLSFAAAVNYATDIGSRSVAVGDFNADGRPDLAVANSNNSLVSILLANAGGTFQAAVNYAAGPAPYSVAVGDFNADGRPDLAVANAGNGSVSILLGTGNPNPNMFAPAANYGVGNASRFVAVGDFNADGRTDLAVANSESSSVSILLGNSNGTFQAAVNYAAGSYPFSVAVGDFNADGRPDLAVANYFSGTVSILLGNVGGTFQAPVAYAGGGSRTGSVAVGDFNADGRPDLALANYENSNVSILLGTGNPNPNMFAPAVNYGVGSFPTFVAVGDFNADGRPDLAVANAGNGSVSILLGNVGGTFQAAVNSAAGSGASSVAVGDFNADGRPDLAVANADSSNVSVLLNTSASSFAVPTITQQPGACQIVQSGQTAMLSVTADGHGNALTYQWRKNGTPLADGGNISGATSPTLTISPARAIDTASYDVQVSAPACGGGVLVTTSTAVIIAVAIRCAADFNADGAVNSADFFEFINAFFAGCP